MTLTRRELGMLGLGAISTSRSFGAAKPNSKFGGVQIGANVPYIFRGMPGGADDILKYCLDPTISLSALELRSRPVEDSLGAPAPPGRPGFRGAFPSGGGGAAPGGVRSGAPPQAPRQAEEHGSRRNSRRSGRLRPRPSENGDSLNR